MTTHDRAALLFVAVIVAVLLWLPAGAQDDPCEACMADWSPTECPCLPVEPEPPPVAGVACPAVPPAVDGCTEHVYLPMVAVSEVTGEGGSGILPVRNGE